MNSSRHFVAAMAGAMALFGAGSVQGADEAKTAIGGGAGAAVGAVVGQAVGGKTGAVVGAGVGGASGAVVGKSVGENAQQQPATASRDARRDDDFRRAAYDDDRGGKKKNKNKRKKNRCDEEHPGRGHAYGKYKDCY